MAERYGTTKQQVSLIFYLPPNSGTKNIKLYRVGFVRRRRSTQKPKRRRPFSLG